VKDRVVPSRRQRPAGAREEMHDGATIEGHAWPLRARLATRRPPPTRPRARSRARSRFVEGGQSACCTRVVVPAKRPLRHTLGLPWHAARHSISSDIVQSTRLG
jgi:hypothetical protein